MGNVTPRCRNEMNGANGVKQKRLFDSSTPLLLIQCKDKTCFTLQKSKIKSHLLQYFSLTLDRKVTPPLYKSILCDWLIFG